MNNLAFSTVRRKEAGQSGLIGPSNAAVTALALRVSGATHMIFVAESKAGIVSVMA